MINDYDYVIVGAGCSGLSLAVELFHSTPANSSIALIDPRRNYAMDRLWCFWNTHSHRFRDAVRHEWNRWKVRYDGNEVVHESSQYAYQYLPADTFYATALKEIDKHPSANLLLGTSAETIIETNAGATILTDKGPITARLAFDGRNSQGRHVGSGLLLQHYAGQRVRVQSPVFDPNTVTLMDFDVPQMGGVSFVYVLPFSPTEALVEPTIFSKQPQDLPVYTRLIQDYLHDRYDIADYEILFREQGIIPMTTQKPQSSAAKRIIPIGTSGGTVKGSTGYGFMAIQQMSQRIAAGLSSDGAAPLPEPRSELATALDRIFISFLTRHPDAAPMVFYNLFRRVPPKHLVPFLTDTADLADMARVVFAMPTLPFIREAMVSMRTEEVPA